MDQSEVQHISQASALIDLFDKPVSNMAITADSLFDQVLKFNLFPALYIDASWVKSLDILQTENFLVESRDVWNPYWLRLFSRTLLDLKQLDKAWDFDFSDQTKRVALINMPDLMNLGHCLGALLIQSYLRRIVSGERVREINEMVGSDNREFALRWMPQHGTSLMQLTTVLKGLSEIAAEAIMMHYDWQRFVIKLIISILPNDAYAVRARLLLKFPMEWRDTESFRLTEEKRHLLSALCADVLQKKYPTWHQSLAYDVEGAL